MLPDPDAVDGKSPLHPRQPGARHRRRVSGVDFDQTVLAKVGRVTGRIAPGQVGEVMIPIRGGSEAFNAYALEPDTVIGVGSRVVVVEFEPPRTVRVQPY